MVYIQMLKYCYPSTALLINQRMCVAPYLYQMCIFISMYKMILTTFWSLFHIKYVSGYPVGPIHTIRNHSRTTYELYKYDPVIDPAHRIDISQSNETNESQDECYQRVNRRIVCHRGTSIKCEPSHTVPKVKFTGKSCVQFMKIDSTTFRHDKALLPFSLVTKGTIWKGGRSSLFLLAYYMYKCVIMFLDYPILCQVKP